MEKSEKTGRSPKKIVSWPDRLSARGFDHQLGHHTEHDAAECASHRHLHARAGAPCSAARRRHTPWPRHQREERNVHVDVLETESDDGAKGIPANRR